MNTQKANIRKMRTAGGLLGIICFGALIGNVLAATPDGQPRQQVVQFADLDVSRAQGITRLYQRIESAAHGVCKPSSDRDLSQVARSRVCLEQAITRAVSKLDIPALTSYYLVKRRGNDTPQRVARQP
jgi:UrcA family protein